MNEAQKKNQGIIDEFRANQGIVGGYFTGKKLLLLHTIGAKSGEERINPASCLVDGDRFVIFASNAGKPNNPNWYYNVVANSDVTIEVGTEKFKARAVLAEEPERTELWEKMVELTPSFGAYPEQSGRVIPVVIINRKM